ncbi:TNF receptor-associated factor 4 isoform X1, partial [Oopsacas minuta]
PKQSYNWPHRNEQTIPNTHVRNTVLSLKCSCPLKERGCEWLGTLGECENHLDACSHVHEKCKFGCGIVLQREELKIHMNDKCEYRKYHVGSVQLKCEKGCGTTVDREKMARHLEKDCGRVVEECKLGCGIELPRHELDMHVNEKCVQRMIPCEHCKKDFKACDMSNHMEECLKMALTCELKCGTVMCREDMVHHLEKDCGCVVEKCKLDCGRKLPRDELNMHVNTKCVQRMIPCEYCHIDFKAYDMSNHNKKCKKCHYHVN